MKLNDAEIIFNEISRCTDGIVFVVDSVDVERMEEAKMELMRTAKCSENHVSHHIWNATFFNYIKTIKKKCYASI